LDTYHMTLNYLIQLRKLVMNKILVKPIIQLYVTFVLLFFISLSSASVSGDELTDTPRFDYYGFVTQGIIKTRGNDYFGISSGNNISLDFREIGIGAKYRATSNLSFTGLALTRDAGGTDNDQPRVDHANIEYVYRNLTLLAGRVKLPLGLYNETRDVANTRPSILLPQSLYFDNARNYLINSDGAYIHYNYFDHDSGNSAKIIFGVAQSVGGNNIETEAFYLGANHPGDVETTTGTLLQLIYDIARTDTTVGILIATNSIKYRPAKVDYLTAGETRTYPLVLSLQQKYEKLTFTGELFLPKRVRKGYGPVIPDKESYTQGQYLMVNYAHNAKLEMFVRHDALYFDNKDKNGTELAKMTGRNNFNFYAKDWTIGGRYHITSNLKISAEYHSIDGTGWLPLADNPDSSSDVRYWDMAMFQMSYSF